jgi:hypothetical protein
MKNKIPFFTGFVVLSILFLSTRAFSEDLILQAPPESGVYESVDTIVAGYNCVIEPGKTVSFGADFAVILKPGFHAKRGSTFTAKPGDCDGLPNDWEMQCFGHLNWGCGDDPDGDRLTNLQEYLLGTDPNSYDIDSDDDSLPDWWELEHFGSLSQGRNDDYDGDGFTNYQEYAAGGNPADAGDRPNPGHYYEYDALGRIKSIVVIK